MYPVENNLEFLSEFLLEYIKYINEFKNRTILKNLYFQ